MFWIAGGSLIIIFYSIRAYINNKQRWDIQKYPRDISRLYFWILQNSNILLTLAGILFFMLAIVCYIKGFQIHFSSDYTYHLHIETG
jgi:hypothetical protein